MKTPLKIIIINILIGIFLLLLLEFVCYKTNVMQAEMYLNRRSEQQKREDKAPPASQYFIKMLPFDYTKEKNRFRKPDGENYKKNSIVILGCSYGYGEGLSDKETLGYKLSQSLNRPVYTRALNGWGTQHLLCQLKRGDFYKEVGNPDLFIYVFIPDHIRRISQPQWYTFGRITYLRYKEKNGKFEEIKPFLYQFWGLYTVRQSQQLWEKYITMNPKNNEKNFNTFVLMMKESKKRAQTACPNSKFIIIKYCDNNENYFTRKEQWKQLENEGFKVIETEGLFKVKEDLEKYTLSDGHPSSEAWDVVVPEVIKTLKLK